MGASEVWGHGGMGGGSLHEGGGLYEGWGAWIRGGLA
jgi:hypothetical protein